jgi:ferredoxin
MSAGSKTMSITIDHIRCGICGGCVAVCPELAMELAAQYLIHYPDRCNLCGKCVPMCPMGCISLDGVK